MTEVLSRPWAQHELSSQQVSASSAEVWTSDLRPLVQATPVWFDSVLRRALRLDQLGLVAIGSISALFEVLSDSIWGDAPQPFISSTESGGITAEFDTQSVHMSIDSEPGIELSTYVAVRDEWDWEGPLRNVPDGIEKWAWRLGASCSDPS